MPGLDSDHDLSAIRRARAYLLRVAQTPAPAVSALIRAHGPVRAADLVWNGDVSPAVLSETSARREHDLVDADTADAAAVGARLVIPEDDEWPTDQMTVLAQVARTGIEWATPPIALWTQSAMPLRDALTNAVSIVGSRAATSYGSTVAVDFAYRLATAGITVVSGGGYGIDEQAHRGALSGDGMTVAIVGTGIDVRYPAGNSPLLDEIFARGVVLSEYAPGIVPARHRFLVRNRLLAGLSRGTVIVEAGVRSGALHVARSARMFGRPVMAVPGDINSATSAGCHHLIRSQVGVLVTSIDDVRDTLDAPTPQPLTT